jgi:hypothetical protein
MPLRLFLAYDWNMDLLAAGLWILAIGTAFDFRYIQRAFRWDWIRLGLGALAGLYLLIPFQLGTTTDADSRLLPALLVCALAVVISLPVRRPALGAALLAVCLGVRFGSIVSNWDRLSERLDSASRSLAVFEPGSRVMPVILIPTNSKEYPEQHFVSWAVISRDIFVPTMLAYRGQQPLAVTIPCGLYLRELPDSCAVDEKQVRQCYDYLWVYNPKGKRLRLPNSFERVFSDDSLTVWRVR